MNLNWKIIGLVAVVVLVVTIAVGMGGKEESGPVTKENAPASTPPPAPIAAGSKTVLSGDPVADIDAILGGESTGDAVLLADADQDAALVTSDAAALSDMTNAYDATQY
jgi:hypothetical protein